MPLKTVLAKIIPRKAKKSLRNFWILADKYGQRRSIKYDKCLDKKGQEIPWYTYPAYEYLNSLDFKDLDILSLDQEPAQLGGLKEPKVLPQLNITKNGMKSLSKDKLII